MNLSCTGNIWQSVEELDRGIGVAADWQHYTGNAWTAWQRGFLDQRNQPAASYHCPRECGCGHRVVHHDDGRIVAVCECDPWCCDNILLTPADVAEWEFNRGRLGRALCRAFELIRREQELGLPWTQQIAAFSTAAVPVVLTIQQDQDEFRHVVAGLAARWRDGFILFAPTSRFVDGPVHELLSHARAKFFDLETHVLLTADGKLQARRPAVELFAAFGRDQPDGLKESEATRIFALLQKLKSSRAGMKAPLHDVFVLTVLRGLTFRDAARECGCSLGLLAGRIRDMETEFGLTIDQLKSYASPLLEMQTTVKGDRRRKGKPGSRPGAFADDEPVDDNRDHNGAAREEDPDENAGDDG